MFWHLVSNGILGIFFNDGGGEGLVQHVSKNTEEI